VLLREMTLDDVEDVLDVQQPAAITGLGHIFPQDTHPFPRDDVGRRWRTEVVDPSIACWVIDVDGTIQGFAAIRGDELLHFGTALPTWGTGLAGAALAAVEDEWRRRDVDDARLFVFAGNTRARTFYERCGWVATGERTQTSFPPHPVLLGYAKQLAE
jgi:RimJ/RimL family protein N-acetyltransferase